jgi:hypothetical protein
MVFLIENHSPENENVGQKKQRAFFEFETNKNNKPFNACDIDNLIQV